MGYLYRTLLLFLLAFSSVGFAQASITVIYSKPSSEQELATKQTIIDSGINQLVVELSKQHFPFSKPFAIYYGSDDGPLYDPEKHTVMMPYQFYTEALTYFKANKYQEKFGRSAESAAVDTLLHTLLHEAGHAYIEDRSMPILGKEEDAVDNFAALIMLEYIEGGDESAISAADMFAFESQDRPDYYDVDEYIDEHSFDLQRYFATLCLIFGSDPQKHAELLDEIEQEYLADRKDFCISHYQNINKNWHIYLKQVQKTYF